MIIDDMYHGVQEILVETQKDIVLLADVCNLFGSGHLGFVVCLEVVVILHCRFEVGDSSIGNEHRAYPVVHQAARHPDLPAIVQCRGGLDAQFPVSQPGSQFRCDGDVEKTLRLKLAIHSDLGQFNVAVKSAGGFGRQLHECVAQCWPQKGTEEQTSADHASLSATLLGSVSV